MNATTYPEFPYTPADYEDIENYFKDVRAWYAPLDERDSDY